LLIDKQILHLEAETDEHPFLQVADDLEELFKIIILTWTVFFIPKYQVIQRFLVIRSDQSQVDILIDLDILRVGDLQMWMVQAALDLKIKLL